MDEKAALELKEQNRTAARTERMLEWPILLAAIVILLVGGSSIWYRATRPYPLDPWESIVVADGYRASVGMPVYTSSDQDHATHMYGPLITYLLGVIYRVTGAGFGPARALSLAATIGIIAALFVLYLRKLPITFSVAGIAMLLSLNLRTGAYFTQCRPDMIALGVAMLGLVLLYRGYEHNQWRWYAVGIVTLCVAYLFKQTAAMFAAVPLVNMLILQRWRSPRGWIPVVIPLVAIALLIAGIRIAWPILHHYMIEVPNGWAIEPVRLVFNSVKFLGFTALLPVALCLWIVAPELFNLTNSRLRWLFAACVVATPASLLTYSKGGGESNSLLPVLLPMTALGVVLLSGGFKMISERTAGAAWRQHAFVWLIAAVMLFGAFGGPNDDLRNIFTRSHGDSHYPLVVQQVRNLTGRVASPDDPTINIASGRPPGRAAWAEYDARLRVLPPDVLLDEIRGADWVVTIDSPWPIYKIVERLEDWNYQKVQWNGGNMGPYTLWRPPAR